MPLARLHSPFDHPEWLFELDGFRALANLSPQRCALISGDGGRGCLSARLIHPENQSRRTDGTCPIESNVSIFHLDDLTAERALPALCLSNGIKPRTHFVQDGFVRHELM